MTVFPHQFGKQWLPLYMASRQPFVSNDWYIVTEFFWMVTSGDSVVLPCRKTTGKKQIQMVSRQGSWYQLSNLREGQPVRIPDIGDTAGMLIPAQHYTAGTMQ